MDLFYSRIVLVLWYLHELRSRSRSTFSSYICANWKKNITDFFSFGSIQVRIQDLVKGGGGPQLPRPKVADVAEQSCASEASYLRPGSRARLRALEAFEFLVLKDAFSHILEPLFSLISDIYIKTQKLTIIIK